MFVRTRSGYLAPIDVRAHELMQHTRVGDEVLVQLRRPRNPKLHRKFFAMIAFAFDHWDPPEQPMSRSGVKDRETFRKELTIAAGYYNWILGLNGEPRLEAKSIAWDRMDDDEFTHLYEAVVAVLAKGFLPGVTPEMMDDWAEQYSRST